MHRPKNHVNKKPVDTRWIGKRITWKNNCNRLRYKFKTSRTTQICYCQFLKLHWATMGYT